MDYLVTLRVVCTCGWLMDQWDLGFVCVNAKCGNRGARFIAKVEMTKVREEAAA